MRSEQGLSTPEKVISVCWEDCLTQKLEQAPHEKGSPPSEPVGEDRDGQADGRIPDERQVEQHPDGAVGETDLMKVQRLRVRVRSHCVTQYVSLQCFMGIRECDIEVWISVQYSQS